MDNQKTSYAITLMPRREGAAMMPGKYHQILNGQPPSADITTSPELPRSWMQYKRCWSN